MFLLMDEDVKLSPEVSMAIPTVSCRPRTQSISWPLRVVF